MGPALVLANYLDLNTLDVTCRVNGETKQQSNTDQFIFDVDELIEYISDVMTLRPGDVISTGTPAVSASSAIRRHNSNWATRLTSKSKGSGRSPTPSWPNKGSNSVRSERSFRLRTRSKSYWIRSRMRKA